MRHNIIRKSGQAWNVVVGATSAKRKRLWNTPLERDTALSLLFIPSALVIGIMLHEMLHERLPLTAPVWIFVAVVVVCLFAAKRPSHLISGFANVALWPLVTAALFTRERHIIVGAVVCAATAGVARWWIDRPGRLARNAFAEGRHCPQCHRPVERRRVHRPIMAGEDQPSETHWFHRCRCGEMTLFEPTAAFTYRAHRLDAHADGSPPVAPEPPRP